MVGNTDADVSLLTTSSVSRKRVQSVAEEFDSAVKRCTALYQPLSALTGTSINTGRYAPATALVHSSKAAGSKGSAASQ